MCRSKGQSQPITSNYQRPSIVAAHCLYPMPFRHQGIIRRHQMIECEQPNAGFCCDVGGTAREIATGRRPKFASPHRVIVGDHGWQPKRRASRTVNGPKPQTPMICISTRIATDEIIGSKGIISPKLMVQAAGERVRNATSLHRARSSDRCRIQARCCSSAAAYSAAYLARASASKRRKSSSLKRDTTNVRMAW